MDIDSVAKQLLEKQIDEQISKGTRPAGIKTGKEYADRSLTPEAPLKGKYAEEFEAKKKPQIIAEPSAPKKSAAVKPKSQPVPQKKTKRIKTSAAAVPSPDEEVMKEVEKFATKKEPKAAFKQISEGPPPAPKAKKIAKASPFAMIEKDLPKGGGKGLKLAEELGETAFKPAAKKGGMSVAKKIGLGALVGGGMGLTFSALMESLDAEETGSEEEDLDVAASRQAEKSLQKIANKKGSVGLNVAKKATPQSLESSTKKAIPVKSVAKKANKKAKKSQEFGKKSASLGQVSANKAPKVAAGLPQGVKGGVSPKGKKSDTSAERDYRGIKNGVKDSGPGDEEQDLIKGVESVARREMPEAFEDDDLTNLITETTLRETDKKFGARKGGQKKVRRPVEIKTRRVSRD